MAQLHEADEIADCETSKQKNCAASGFHITAASIFFDQNGALLVK
jgi:hypothetical protein